jgi:hypothetical protein
VSLSIINFLYHFLFFATHALKANKDNTWKKKIWKDDKSQADGRKAEQMPTIKRRECTLLRAEKKTSH